MKKKIILICVFVLLVAGVVTAVVLFNTNKNKNTYGLLECSSGVEVRKIIKTEELEENVYDEKLYTSIHEYKILDSIANAEIIYTEDDRISYFALTFDLFLYDFSEEEKLYTLTAKDKEKIEKDFNKIKTAFGEYLGCELVKYDVIPVKELDKLEDTDEAFYNGDIIREYSVRDENGTLWLLTYEASAGTASAKLEKVVDEGGYVGFIPSIDLTK